MKSKMPALSQDDSRWRWTSLFTCLLLVFVWFGNAYEVEPHAISYEKPSSRFMVMKGVIETSNQGYHYQHDPLRAMEWNWEDPGLSFYTVTWGFLKRALGYGDLNPYEDPYIVEFFFIIFVIWVLHSRSLFQLRRNHYSVIVLFFIFALLPWWEFSQGFPNRTIYNQLPDGLLYLSASTRWAKVLMALLIFATAMSLLAWSSRPETCTYKSMAVKGLLVGLMVGILATVRKDSLLPGLLGIGLTVLWIIWRRRAGSGEKGAAKGFLVRGLLFLMLFTVGTQIPKWGFYATWNVRDKVYEMTDTQRIYGHPTWHVLYISLGFVDNPLGIKWNDGVGWDHVRRLPENKGIRYATREHEAAAKILFFDTIRKYPTLIFENMWAKAVRLWQQQKNFILLGIGSIAAILLFFPLWRDYAVVLGLIWLGTTPIPVVVYPHISFYLDFIAQGLILFLFFVVLVGNRLLEFSGLAAGRLVPADHPIGGSPSAGSEPLTAAAGRQDLKSRLFNEGDTGPRALFRAAVLYFGFLLTKAFDGAGLFRRRWGRRLYYWIYAAGKHLTDADKKRLIRRLIRPGDTCIDIGGAFGVFTRTASEAVGSGGRVIVLEPDPVCAQFIQDIVDSKEGGNVELKRMAAWNEESELVLNLCKENRGENSLFASPIHDESIIVPAGPVDDLCEGNQAVTFIKMDIQGAECIALEGMKKTLSKQKRIAVLTECSPDDLKLAGGTMEQMMDILLGAGLVVYRLDVDSIREIHGVEDLQDLTEAPFRQCDLLAVRSEEPLSL